MSSRPGSRQTSTRASKTVGIKEFHSQKTHRKVEKVEFSSEKSKRPEISDNRLQDLENQIQTRRSNEIYKRPVPKEPGGKNTTNYENFQAKPVLRNPSIDKNREILNPKGDIRIICCGGTMGQNHKHCCCCRLIEFLVCLACFIIGMVILFHGEDLMVQGLDIAFTLVSFTFGFICLFDLLGYSMLKSISCHYTWVLFTTMAYLLFITLAGVALTPEQFEWTEILILVAAVVAALVFLIDLLLILCKKSKDEIRPCYGTQQYEKHFWGPCDIQGCTKKEPHTHLVYQQPCTYAAQYLNKCGNQTIDDIKPLLSESCQPMQTYICETCRKKQIQPGIYRSSVTSQQKEDNSVVEEFTKTEARPTQIQKPAPVPEETETEISAVPYAAQNAEIKPAPRPSYKSIVPPNPGISGSTVGTCYENPDNPCYSSIFAPVVSQSNKCYEECLFLKDRDKGNMYGSYKKLKQPEVVTSVKSYDKSCCPKKPQKPCSEKAYRPKSHLCSPSSTKITEVKLTKSKSTDFGVSFETLKYRIIHNQNDPFENACYDSDYTPKHTTERCMDDCQFLKRDKRKILTDDNKVFVRASKMVSSLKCYEVPSSCCAVTKNIKMDNNDLRAFSEYNEAFKDIPMAIAKKRFPELQDPNCMTLPKIPSCKNLSRIPSCVEIKPKPSYKSPRYSNFKTNENCSPNCCENEPPLFGGFDLLGCNIDVCRRGNEGHICLCSMSQSKKKSVKMSVDRQKSCCSISPKPKSSISSCGSSIRFSRTSKKRPKQKSSISSCGSSIKLSRKQPKSPKECCGACSPQSVIKKTSSVLLISKKVSIEQTSDPKNLPKSPKRSPRSSKQLEHTSPKHVGKTSSGHSQTSITVQKKSETSILQKNPETSILQKETETSILQKKSETSIQQEKSPKTHGKASKSHGMSPKTHGTPSNSNGTSPKPHGRSSQSGKSSSAKGQLSPKIRKKSSEEETQSKSLQISSKTENPEGSAEVKTQFRTVHRKSFSEEVESESPNLQGASEVQKSPKVRRKSSEVEFELHNVPGSPEVQTQSQKRRRKSAEVKSDSAELRGYSEIQTPSPKRRPRSSEEGSQSPNRQEYSEFQSQTPSPRKCHRSVETQSDSRDTSRLSSRRSGSKNNSPTKTISFTAESPSKSKSPRKRSVGTSTTSQKSEIKTDVSQKKLEYSRRSDTSTEEFSILSTDVSIKSSKSFEEEVPKSKRKRPATTRSNTSTVRIEEKAPRTSERRSRSSRRHSERPRSPERSTRYTERPTRSSERPSRSTDRSSRPSRSESVGTYSDISISEKKAEIIMKHLGKNINAEDFEMPKTGFSRPTSLARSTTSASSTKSWENKIKPKIKRDTPKKPRVKPGLSKLEPKQSDRMTLTQELLNIPKHKWKPKTGGYGRRIGRSGIGSGEYSGSSSSQEFEIMTANLSVKSSKSFVEVRIPRPMSTRSNTSKSLISISSTKSEPKLKELRFASEASHNLLSKKRSKTEPILKKYVGPEASSTIIIKQTSPEPKKSKDIKFKSDPLDTITIRQSKTKTKNAETSKSPREIKFGPGPDESGMIVIRQSKMKADQSSPKNPKEIKFESDPSGTIVIKQSKGKIEGNKSPKEIKVGLDQASTIVIRQEPEMQNQNKSSPRKDKKSKSGQPETITITQAGTARKVKKDEATSITVLLPGSADRK